MNIRFLLFAGLLFGFVATVSCQPNTQTPKHGELLAFTNLEVADFRAKIDDDNVVILDVRTPAETAQGMIEGAIELNVNAPDFAQRVSELDKDKTYLVYCRSGRRSVTACNVMHNQGFDSLYNLVGGYLAWTRE